MDDSQPSALNQRIKAQEARTLKRNPLFEALANILENDQPVCVCQLMSELDRLTEKEQVAEDKKAEK